MSDSQGTIHDPEGIDEDKLAYIMNLKNVVRGRIKEYAAAYSSAEFMEGQRPWSVSVDVALPCATQNELNGEEATTLLSNGCVCVAEGANMPSTLKPLKPSTRPAFCLPWKGVERGWCGHLGIGNVPKLLALQLDT